MNMYEFRFKILFHTTGRNAVKTNNLYEWELTLAY